MTSTITVAIPLPYYGLKRSSGHESALISLCLNRLAPAAKGT
jgi:hypothetical protein